MWFKRSRQELVNTMEENKKSGKPKPLVISLRKEEEWPAPLNAFLQSYLPPELCRRFAEEGVRLTVRFDSPYPRPKAPKKEPKLPDGFIEELDSAGTSRDALLPLLEKLSAPQLKKLAEVKGLTVHTAKKTADRREILLDALRAPDVWREIAGVKNSTDDDPLDGDENKPTDSSTNDSTD